MYDTRNHRLKHLGFRSYREYLLSDHWLRTRKWFFYSGYVSREPVSGVLVCSRCHQPAKPPNVHHKTYQNLGHEPLTDLELLCRDCHSREHHH